MHIKDAKAFLPLVRALAEGKTIQYNGKPEMLGFTWEDADDTVGFTDRPECYRIKPEPTWRAWKQSEVPKFFMVKLLRPAFSTDGSDHDPNVFLAVLNTFGKVKVKALVSVEVFRPEDMFRRFTRLDEHGNATPCGVLENP